MHPRNLHKTELRNALVAFLTLFCSMRSIGLIDLWGAEKVFIVEMDISSSEWTNIWQRAGLPNSWNLQRSAVQPQRNQIANIFPNLCRRMHLLRSSNIRIRPKAASQPRNSRANCKRDLFFLELKCIKFSTPLHAAHELADWKYWGQLQPYLDKQLLLTISLKWAWKQYWLRSEEVY